MKFNTPFSLALLTASFSSAQQALLNPNNADDWLGGFGHTSSVPVDISSLFDNRGFAMKPGDANFDQLHSGYPAEYLPPPNITYNGVNFTFPQYKTSGNDNALATGQIVQVPQGRYISVHMLAAAEAADAIGWINATYSDNTTTSGPILVHPFWDWPYPFGGDIVFPHYLTNSSVDYNRSMIFHTIDWLDSTKELVSIQLPNITEGADTGPGGSSVKTRLHVFSLSLTPARGHGKWLDIQYARSTNAWFEGTNKTQIIEVTVNNVGTDWILTNDSFRVTVSAPGYTTVIPGVINRLRPGDQARVQVGVVNSNGTAAGTSGEATVLVTGHGEQFSYSFNATYGILPYEPTFESIYSHESPQWYNNAKFGIFIHWGVYSVPAWGNVGKNESYAEWYWWNMNSGPDTKDRTYEYNLQTYGPNHVYDDFIQNFTASVFNPKDWVDLFADAGANYFVQVSKHHDGYAIFDLPSNVTKRTSVALPPYRNLLGELFDAAAQHQPQLHRATYFSLPEWFSPAYRPYGFGEWPGGNATNPYTNVTLPYTGFVPVSDYVPDVILPEMQALASLGTEIMWCDIGGPNLTVEFAASWFNAAAQQGKQVLLDNRCGLPGDFDTPEYARYDAVQVRKWESNLGMDPFSYGYNRATPASAYLQPRDIVTSLIDIVSKNGNFLLDVGPTANGTIVEIEHRNLRDAGRWIKGHGEAIFNTSYWFVTPEEGQAIRFTQTVEAFYVLCLYPPNSTLVLESPIPYVEGDRITVVGGNMSGEVVPSRLRSDGSVEIMVDESVVQADQYAWVFKIGYGSGSGSGSGNETSTVGGNGTVVGTGAVPSATGVVVSTGGAEREGYSALLLALLGGAAALMAV